MNYAHPEALVETAWLAAHLGDQNLRILDGTFTLPGVSPTGPELYARQHIPGAIYFDIEEIKDAANPLPHMLPDAPTFARMMTALGVGSRHKIVVYDAFGLASAPRVWWTLRAFGHKDVAILNGGLPKWLAENLPVTAKVPKFPTATFDAKLDRGRVRNKAQMLANLQSRREQVIDARSAGRFAGTEPEPRAGLHGGHIPGSVSLPSTEFVDKATRTVLPADALAAKFRAAGVDPAKPAVSSCGSGVTACAIAFGMHLLGWPETAVYDGSWSEWGLPGDTPVETGAR
ncbi:MAG: 3-mercaptopyruvate sulfurtransferase [Alphaproteobacteria bacterium]|nr:3-mercaptopyruvate sulfurtransferase [Alphaproteobacteria bacterium]